MCWLVHNGDLGSECQSLSQPEQGRMHRNPRHFPRTRNFETVYIARRYRKLVDMLNPIFWGAGGWWSVVWRNGVAEAN